MFSAMRGAPWLTVCLTVATLAGSACREEGTVRVRSLEFKGLDRVNAARLKGALATRVSSKLPWGRSALFDRSRFDADLKRIVAFCADRGFPDARVTAFDVKLNDKQDAVDLTVTVDEGQPVTVAAVRFIGFEVVPPGRLEALRNGVPLEPGRPRDRQQVGATHEMALNELREHGYAYARVSTDENDGATGREATITFTAEPGPLAHFGAVEIVGNSSVSDRIILRQLTYRPGDLYRRSVVQNSQRRLYGMELFQFVNIESLNPERMESEVRTRVTVAEGKHQRLSFSAGYGSEEKARVEGEYRHVNFLGGARSAGARARWSSLDRGMRVDFNQPYFFDPHLSFGMDGQQWWTYTPAYRSLVTGGKMTVTRRRTPQMSWAVSLTSERNSSEIAAAALLDPTLRDELIALGLDPTTGRQDGVLNAFGFDYQRSTADNPLNARRGYQVAFHVEEAGRLLPGTFNYHAVSADGRHYLPISERVVLANRLQLGNIVAVDGIPGNVPFAKKYFLGGATSIRGWGRYEVSPLSGSGLPIGGNALIAFSSELRTSFSSSVGGVLFLDGGNVWPEAREIQLADLRYAAGVGFRYQTPVGPIRFDLGYQLNPIPNLLIDGNLQSRRWRLHFSIGQAF
jgi:outer membrane protein insertion porin family/translocation and assembly module TamA